MTAARTDAARSATMAVAGAALAVLAWLPRGAHAAEPAGRWFSVGVLGGSAQPVASLADYQWDVRPHAAWGAQALVGRGAWSGGVRVWRSGTTQALGLAGTPDPRVSTTSFDVVGRARVASWRGLECLGVATGGRLAIRYQPDHVTIDTGAGPVEVAFEPVWSWVAGAGLGLRAPLRGGWSLGLETERRVFALDTAHRSGAAVTNARDTFGDWHARLELARAWGW
jgi:hypothetical protein